MDNNYKINSLIKPKSKLSKMGYKPLNFDTINKKSKKNSNDSKRIDMSKNKKNKNKNDFHKLKNYDNGYSFETKKTKKIGIKNKIPMIISMVLVEIVTLVCIFVFGTFLRYSNMTQKVTFNKANIKNENIEQSTLEIMKGYKTVAVFGLDARSGSVGRGSNADVNMIINLNLETGGVKIISIYRDTFLNISKNNSYGKLNSAYSHGGPERAVDTLNKNFDLDIENYFSFNWQAVADGIDMLGGVGIYVTSAEFLYINAFIHEYCKETGIGADNPAAYYIIKPGYQILNGVQALSYCRLRLMDNDFKRRERQVEVMKQCLENAKNLDLGKINEILQKVLPQISYAFDMNEMLSIAKTIKGIHIENSEGIPEINYMVMQDMGAHGNCVVPNTLVRAAKKVHEILYNETDYKPSSAVNTYSNRIAELKNQYKEENENKIENSEGETDSENNPVPINTSTNKPRRATSSNSTNRNSGSSNNANSTTNTNNDNVNPNARTENNETVVPNIGGENETTKSDNNDVRQVNNPPYSETNTNTNNDSRPVAYPGSENENSNPNTTANSNTNAPNSTNNSNRITVPGMDSSPITSNSGPGSVNNDSNIRQNSDNLPSNNDNIIVVPGGPIS